jgi:hypothetical protein
MIPGINACGFAQSLRSNHGETPDQHRELRPGQPAAPLRARGSGPREQSLSHKRTIARLRITACCMSLAGAAMFVVRVADAQMDLSGEWRQKVHQDAPERGDGPDIGDYTGMPITDADRMRGDAWDSEKWVQLEHECEPHPADYSPRGPGSIRIWADMDPHTMQVTTWHTEIMWMQPERAIYMDGRPRPPPYAASTWQGWSSGEWDADMLKVRTDHLKEGWLRRNGLARSEKAHLTEFYLRHDDYLTLATIVHDPVYLSEPYIRTSNWVLDPGYKPMPSTCTPTIEVPHPKGWVAYQLPGQNPNLNDYAAQYGMPPEAARGGAETMYPEYQQKLEHLPISPGPSPGGSARDGK